MNHMISGSTVKNPISGLNMRSTDGRRKTEYSREGTDHIPDISCP